MDYSCSQAIFITTLLISLVLSVRGQISTPCTSSMITTFTPCLNFVTGSTANGGSPTEECCNSFKTLMTDSVDCTCLIITGNVPVSIPFINRNLAISLPRICKTSVPLQCKASGDPLPAPGPAALFGPNPTSAPTGLASPPHRAHSPKASKATSVAAPPPVDETLDMSPASPPEPSLGPSANPGIRPVINHQSDSVRSFALPFNFVILLGIMAFNF